MHKEYMIVNFAKCTRPVCNSRASKEGPLSPTVVYREQTRSLF